MPEKTRTTKRPCVSNSKDCVETIEMSRSYALKKLLEHGALTRREIVEITGWKEKQVHFTLAYLSQTGQIIKHGKAWSL